MMGQKSTHVVQVATICAGLALELFRKNGQMARIGGFLRYFSFRHDLVHLFDPQSEEKRFCKQQTRPSRLAGSAFVPMQTL